MAKLAKMIQRYGLKTTMWKGYVCNELKLGEQIGADAFGAWQWNIFGVSDPYYFFQGISIFRI